jgi:hypothetical protein
MEQIYYTQCPMGYGLGASNGFQVKRLDAGYPTSGDFRHLGMRAFLPGTRTLAPPALRYRWDGGAAEVAWLTPRPQEYETERGLWGRPGGHFAHGIRLSAEELDALASWPAGLYDSPFWCRSDPEPSRGRPPHERPLRPEDLSRPPTFAAVAPLTANEEVETIARLLTALAIAVREGRTVFLIDLPDRLPTRVALLTFAFPSSMRGALTFSTYHDRPEELPGYRLHGTVPAARPNRAALVGQGLVADLVAGQFEPRVEPAAWATTLAGWLVRGGKDEETAWSKTDTRARRARPPEPPETIWSDSWLDRLVAFHEGSRIPAVAPADEGGWRRLAEMTAWAGRAGLAEEWLIRGPSWWKEAAGVLRSPEARAALVAHGALRDAWQGPRALAAAWGEALASGFGGSHPENRFAAVVTFLRAAPASACLPFLAALLKALPAEAADEVLDRLKGGRSLDPDVLMPLEVRGALAGLLTRSDPEPLRDLLARALAAPAALTAVLDALASEVERGESPGRVAETFAEALEAAGPDGRDAAIAWALGRGDEADAWVGPFLRRLFDGHDGRPAWRDLRERTPDDLRAVLAWCVLTVAQGEGVNPEAFRWGVEELLLALPDVRRPHDPSWPEAYLRRTPSGLDLIKRLFAKDQRHPVLRRWLAEAHARGEISAEQLDRIERCKVYAQTLASGDSSGLLQVHLPDVASHERGALLGQMLGHLGGADRAGLGLCLEASRVAWPGGFDAGAAGLSGLARPLAEAIAAHRYEPAVWFEHLTDVLDRLGLDVASGRGLEPNGLAAEVVAATTRLPDAGEGAWSLRQALFRRDEAWKTLATDARSALVGQGPRAAVKALDQWDARLDKGRLSARFFELMLNACDGLSLAAAASARAPELRTLDALPWWDAPRHEGARDDLRDAFARLAPMDPLGEEALQPVRNWMPRPGRSEAEPPQSAGPETLDMSLLEGGEPSRTRADRPRGPGLSGFGEARWRCLEALSALHRAGLDGSARWPMAIGWEAVGLPLDRLSSDDRHRFVAWVIHDLGPFEAAPVDRLARWLFKMGVRDADRIKGWAEELSGAADVTDGRRIERAVLVNELGREVRALVREARERRRPGVAGSP